MMKKEISLQEMLERSVNDLQCMKKWGTAKVYKAVQNSVTQYMKGRAVSLHGVTPEWLLNYEEYLCHQRKSWNTVSTYMKICRSAYNSAVDLGLVDPIHRLFHHVFTGIVSKRANAMDIGILRKMMEPNDYFQKLSVSQMRTLKIFMLLFLLRGMPFVDFAFLRKNDIQNHILTYRRKKTGREIQIKLTPDIINLIRDLSTDTSKRSPYVFNILHHNEWSSEAYLEYTSALRKFNKQLKDISKIIGIDISLSSYKARHSWATMAYYSGVNPGVISQSLGHASLSTTEIYMNPFRNEQFDKANEQVLNYVRMGK